MHKLRENAEKELKAIEEKGLSQSNIDNAYKLVCITEKIDKINMMQDGGYSQEGYSRDMEDYSRERGGYSRNGDYSREGNYSNDYDNGNSYRRGRSATTGRYVHRPNYSRLSGDDTDMDRYKEDKKQYSNSRDGGDKNRMLDSLETLVANVCDMVVQIDRDCDCVDERDIIFKHVKNLYDRLRR
ncbi:hypothetical protein C805_00063 [Eubacterium sp. 14-2]|uniref:hypothetical protein n=1 Tax=Eubacterium sp. 14-2 TaxID=1235790 RepID=UPI00033BD47F|nr:hypothetical protein [Eubacterium sp. 14-2]EOT29480.1 hypothetical protein C805_00063 [Eubacterium sp. 14-2]